MKNNLICNIVVIDDDLECCNSIKKTISEQFNNVNIESNVCSLHTSTKLSKNLYLIDIELGDCSGFDVAKRLCKKDPYALIVFISNHKDYVFNSFEYKPYMFLRKAELNADLQRLIIRLKNDYFGSYIFPYYGQEIVLPINDILYVLKYINHVEIYTYDNKFIQNTTLKSIKKSLEELSICFIQINESTLVNLNHVLNYNGKRLVLSNNKQLYPSRKYQKKTKISFIEYQK